MAAVRLQLVNYTHIERHPKHTITFNQWEGKYLMKTKKLKWWGYIIVVVVHSSRDSILRARVKGGRGLSFMAREYKTYLYQLLLILVKPVVRRCREGGGGIVIGCYIKYDLFISIKKYIAIHASCLEIYLELPLSKLYTFKNGRHCHLYLYLFI